MPWKLEGLRIDPPPSVPMAPKAERIATAVPRPATRAAWRVIGVPGVAGRGHALAICEFDRMGLADDDRSGFLQTSDYRRIAVRVEALQCFRAGLGWSPPGIDNVLYPDRDPVQRPQPPAATRQLGIGLRCCPMASSGITVA